MYFDKMVHDQMSLKQRCPLIGGVVKGRDNGYLNIILLVLSFDRLGELSNTLTELYLGFNKMTSLDPVLGELTHLLMLDIR